MRADLYVEIFKQEEYFWWHQAKRSLVKSFIPHRRSLKILDIGCGTGKLLQELKSFGQVWGIDKNKQAVKFCRQRGLKQVIKENFPHIKTINKHFNFITCLDVLEHIAKDEIAIKTIKKLLAKDGRLVLTVPAYPWLFSYWDKILKHKRRYTKASLHKLLTDSGLKVIKISYLYSFLLPIAIPFRLIRQQIFKNKKPQSDFIEMPQIFHQLLLLLAKTEQRLLKYIDLPFGLSLVCVAEKP